MVASSHYSQHNGSLIYVLAVSIIAAVGGFLFGYDTAGLTEEHPDNEDLRWVQRRVWSQLVY